MVIAMTKPPLSDSLLFRLFAFVNKNISCVHSYPPRSHTLFSDPQDERRALQVRSLYS